MPATTDHADPGGASQFCDDGGGVPAQPAMPSQRAAAKRAASKYMGSPILNATKTVHLVRISNEILEGYVRRHSRENVVPNGGKRLKAVTLSKPVYPGAQLYVVTQTGTSGQLKGTEWVAGCAESLHDARRNVEGRRHSSSVTNRVWQVTVKTVPVKTTLMTIEEDCARAETTADVVPKETMADVVPEETTAAETA